MCHLTKIDKNSFSSHNVLICSSKFSGLSQITVLRYGVALVNECGLKQWYIMY